MVRFYRAQALAESTKASYRTFRKCYLDFCNTMNYEPLPASNELLCRYIAHLAERLQFNSIPKYMSVVRLLHLESGFQNPLVDNWLIDSLLKGIKRHLGTKVSQKLPITPSLLWQVHKTINLSETEDCIFWAVCLTLFFGLLRKSNVLCTQSSFQQGKHLARDDIHITGEGVVLVIRWSKTIQYQQRTLRLPMPMHPSHPLCPSSAIMRALAFTAGAPQNGPAFVLPSSEGFIAYPPSRFVSRLRSTLLPFVVDPSHFSTHSFRRGGASWAFSCNIPGEMIQIMGDWRSDSYLRYLEVPMSTKRSYVQHCLSSLPPT